jgi:type I restriction enzyme R subunit
MRGGAVDVEARIREFASRSQNFGFLLHLEPLLVATGAGAEAFVYAEPNVALLKARQFGEVLVGELVRRLGLRVEGHGGKPPTQLERIKTLVHEGAVTPEIERLLHEVRRVGNRAAHEGFSDTRVALVTVRQCFELGQWFHLTVTGEREVRGFVPPEPGLGADPVAVARLREDLDRYRHELEETRLRLEGNVSQLVAEEAARREAQRMVEDALRDRDQALAVARSLEEQIQALTTARVERYDALARKPEKVTAAQREALVERARQPRPLNEAEARRVIDRMLADAGWAVQDYANLRPLARQGVAVREFPLATGRADYMLYVDGKIVGVIEAKREGMPLTGVEWQTDRYARALPKSHALAAWHADRPLPFRYESTGTETRFTNGLDPEPRSREVFSFHRPETLARWMQEADTDPQAPTLRAKLRHMPDLLTEGLRPAQVDAVHGVEDSLARDLPRALVQMATGAGKTYAAVTSSYRLLKHAKAQRILFLVDRNNLGKQAVGEFRNYVTPDDGRKFTELYNVQRLTGPEMLGSSKVVISTIQRMYVLLRGEPLPDVDDDNPQFDRYDRDRSVDVSYNPDVPPETFDLVVVDECHRSIYGTWRPVLEYFDAHLLGLTATPVKQTFGFFHQNLVAQYTYEQAVADKVNVDFDVYRIRTEITESGGHIPAGIVVPRRDLRTRRQRYEELEDDLTYSGRQLGRSIVAEDQIRLVLTTFHDKLFTEIFPGRSTVPKTLVFAVNDNHAEDVVRIVREVFGKGNDFAAKITYTARREGRDPEALIQAFRNSPELRVAVTVDMIATGTDVRPIECVLFLRGVRTRTYFEQMKGRGSRTIDPTEFQAVTPDAKTKTRFVIVDAVGMTDGELPEAAPLQRHTERQISLKKLLDKTATLAISTDETATLASRLARLDIQLTEEEQAEIARLAARPLRALVKDLVDAVDPDRLEAARLSGGERAERELILAALRPLTENPELRTRLLEIRQAHDVTYDEVSRDQLIQARVIPAEERARVTVRSWHDYLAQHRDEISAIQVLYSRRGGRGTYAMLRELANRIGRPPQVWTPDGLWEAYERLGRAVQKPGVRHGVTELISLIRYELGLEDELRPFGCVVREHFQAWLRRQEQAGVEFTPEQTWWLEKIAEVIANSAEIKPSDLEEPPFTERGATLGFERAFGDRAVDILDELDQELTA